MYIVLQDMSTLDNVPDDYEDVPPTEEDTEPVQLGLRAEPEDEGSIMSEIFDMCVDMELGTPGTSGGDKRVSTVYPKSCNIIPNPTQKYISLSCVAMKMCSYGNK